MVDVGHPLDSAIRAALRDQHLEDMRIDQLESQTNWVLQTVDFVAWAIRRKYELGEQEYYDLIKSRIEVEIVIGAE